MIESGSLINSRNALLKEAWQYDIPAVMVDDDMVSLSRIVDSKFVPITFQECVEGLIDALDQTQLKFAGVSTLSNLFWYNPKRPMSLNAMLACLVLIKPCELLFDENLEIDGQTEKEDLDYSLQHIQRYGGVVRVNYLTGKFQQTTWNKSKEIWVKKQTGGLNKAEYISKQTFDIMMEKWGKYVRPNPTTKHQLRINIR